LDKLSGIVLRAAHKAGVPVRISHSHNTQSEGGLAARTYKWYAGRFINPNATKLIACSDDAAKWLFKRKAKSAQIVKNGIEYERFTFSGEKRKQIREELHLETGNEVIGHVGRFNRQKNHSFLIDVFAELANANDRAVLLLVGDGPLRSEIEQKVRKLNLESKVFFLGIRSDIDRILQGMDLFVFPSFHEGLPVSLIEAQVAELPCLISDRVSREVDLGVHLVHYAPLGDPVLWAEQITRISKRGRSWVNINQAVAAKGYNIRETAAEMEDFYVMISGCMNDEMVNHIYSSI
jgi:glycosyltransferase involved in cell wall biosynthesis